MEVDVKLYYQSRLNDSGTFHSIYFILFLFPVSLKLIVLTNLCITPKASP